MKPKIISKMKPKTKAKIKLVTGAMMIVCLLLATVMAGFTDPYSIDLTLRLQPPGASGISDVSGILGTDHLGRDVFSRMIYGARLSVTIALATMLVSLILGVATGLVAGYFGGIFDNIINFTIETLLAFPGMLLSLAIVSVAGGGIFNAVIAVSIVSWIGYARLTRSMVMSFKEREFVVASHTQGAGHYWVLTRHILSNMLTPIVIYSATNIGSIIMQLAALSFLGLGVQPPTAEWGAMLNDARGYITVAPWLTILPSAGLVFMVIGFNLFGEGLAQYFDRRSR